MTQTSDVRHLISPIDTRRFGFGIAKINDFELLIQPELRAQLRAAGVKLIIARINSNRIEQLNQLEEQGFRIKDMQTTYRLRFRKQAIDRRGCNDGEVEIRSATREDIPEMRRIALACFEGYGHYFADLRLSREACREIYADWTEREVLAQAPAGKKVFLAEVAGRIAGFGSMGITESGGQRFAASGIAAVDYRSLGKGAMTTIIADSLQWSLDHGCVAAEYYILNSNYGMHSSLASTGCKVSGSSLTLHDWLDT